jgi:hypothetical protein
MKKVTYQHPKTNIAVTKIQTCMISFGHFINYITNKLKSNID